MEIKCMVNGKYVPNINKWKYLTDPLDKIMNPTITTMNEYLVDGIYMLGNNKFLYSFDNGGYLETGFLNKNSKIYYAERKGNFIGALVKGIEEIDGVEYLFNDYTAELMPPSDGVYKVTKGEAVLNPTTNCYNYYIIKDNGDKQLLTNGMYKLQYEQKYYNYYFDAFGNMMTGIVTYNNKKYYMGIDGREDEAMTAELNKS